MLGLGTGTMNQSSEPDLCRRALQESRCLITTHPKYLAYLLPVYGSIFYNVHAFD